MSAVTTRQFAVEVHPTNWHFPAGPSWLAGWIFAGENRLVTDLRAWIDGRPFLGFHGLPKPGLDEKFLGRPGPPYAGFVLQVEPHRGATLLRLEARDLTGTWTEFFRTPITVAATAAAATAATPLSARLADLVSPLLRRHTQQPTTAWAALADEILSAALSHPLNSLPNPPFHGALEEPRELGRLRYGRLAVTGWLAHRTEKIKRLTALVDAIQECSLLYGLPRADIGGVFADLPGRENSQFIGHVDLPANQSTPALLKIFAELDNGEKHLAFAQRFTPRVIAGADTPLPPLSRITFGQALWALRGSAQRHGLPLGSWQDLAASSQIAWTAYQAEAPAKLIERKNFLPAVVAPVKPSTRPLRVLIVTHNLNFEGAPWFIFELAQYLARQPHIKVRVLAPQAGPLREVFIAAGMPVDIVDLTTTLAAKTPEDFNRNLTAAVSVNWSVVDLVIANTMVSFWAVHLAAIAQKPTLLYVHESSPLRRFFEPLVNAALFPIIEEAFRAATHVVFTASASQTVFNYLDTRRHFRLLPSWVDVGRIDAFIAAHDKIALRRKHGLDPAAVLLVNIGSICERKGQHIYLRAAELLQQELRYTYPGQNIQFVMVGARPGLYLDSLKQEAALHQLAEIVFLPESGEIYDFYLLADIFVCTSFEESFPRVLLESAAFRLPIISTNVNGIAEMLAPDEAWLIPPGDRYQLAEAIKAGLTAHFSHDTRRADKARASVERKYHEAHSLPQHTALAFQAVQRNS